MAERYVSDFSVEFSEGEQATHDEEVRTFDVRLSQIMAQNGVDRQPPGDPNWSRKIFQQSRALEFIDEVAAYSPTGSLDITATANNLSIPVIYRDIIPKAMFEYVHESITKATPTKYRITLSEGLGNDENMSFGHEIGHYFIEEVVNVSQTDLPRNQQLENFCNFFGRHMALPTHALNKVGAVEEQTVVDLSSVYDVRAHTVLLQLSENDLLPNRVALDTKISTKNDYEYAGKITRVRCCLYCEEATNNTTCPNAGNNDRLFDFTDHEWGYDFGRECITAEMMTLPAIKKLTAMYAGRKLQ